MNKLIAGGLALLLSACSQHSTPKPVPEVEIKATGQKIDYSSKAIDGKVMNPKENEGVVVLICGATYCGPCKKDLPGYVDIQEKYSGKAKLIGFEFNSSDDDIKKLIEMYKLNFPVVNAGDSKGDISQRFGGVYGYPTTFVLKDGEVVAKYVDPESLPSVIDRLTK